VEVAALIAGLRQDRLPIPLEAIPPEILQAVVPDIPLGEGILKYDARPDDIACRENSKVPQAVPGHEGRRPDLQGPGSEIPRLFTQVDGKPSPPIADEPQDPPDLVIGEREPILSLDAA
jgi:hypothetical protein